MAEETTPPADAEAAEPAAEPAARRPRITLSRTEIEAFRATLRARYHEQ
ncbi:hypothetical protein IU500_20900 [Nocardia terpenica]|nr:hypothetical protein [Nocardia terpenica]MBF6064162.1 hypothetical protein [Nocardia terpenica]MBF6106495.1 hypothetical protein [Nocardia terpenica]MBF6113780.1 hypothetical protein [Nocardia terpenica]MBF6120596.1 hypothetical protein [Nocardia terpenica]MBF6154747.1 hypothetical protein [Nocardia terpenica]